MAAKHIALAQGLTGAPASVAVAVYDEAGVLLETIPAGEPDRVGSENAYVVDLRACSVAEDLELPPDGSSEERHYVLVWTDNAPSKVITRELVEGSRGRLDAGREYVRETFIFPTTSIPQRGITPEVVYKGEPSYLKIEKSPNFNFAAPVEVRYVVYFYNSSGRLERAEPSSAPPNP